MDKRPVVIFTASAALLSLPAPEMDADRKPKAKALDTPDALHIDSERLADPIPVLVQREARPFEPMLHNDPWLPLWEDGDGVDADTTPLGSPIALMASADQQDASPVSVDG